MVGENTNSLKIPTKWLQEEGCDSPEENPGIGGHAESSNGYHHASSILSLVLCAEELGLCWYMCVTRKGKIHLAHMIFVSWGL